jgi:tetratricopeptide (TPR) repeat protein
MLRIARITLILMIAASVTAEQGPADPLWELYQAGRFDDVINRGKALINTGQGTAQVQLAVGRALTDTGSFAEAVLFLEGAVSGDPDRTWVYAWGQVYLGSCHWKLGDSERARRAWIAARDADATRNATRNAVGNLSAFGLAESFDDWQRFRTDHFHFLFSDRLTDLDRTDFARRREEAYAEISAWFGGGPAEPVLFVVWSDQAEADAAGMPTLGFARPDLNLIHALVNQTVGHEMTHIVSNAALEPTARTGLINEGTAVRFDQTGRDRMATARRALADAGDLPRVSLAALWEDWSLLPGEVTYPLAGAWVDRLIDKGGREHFLTFFTDQSLAHAREVYGDRLQGWMEDFEADLGL